MAEINVSTIKSETHNGEFSTPIDIDILAEAGFVNGLKEMINDSIFNKEIIKRSVIGSIPGEAMMLDANGKPVLTYEGSIGFVNAIGDMLFEKKAYFRSFYNSTYGQHATRLNLDGDIKECKLLADKGDMEAIRKMRTFYINPDSDNFNLDSYYMWLLKAITSDAEDAKLEAGFDRHYIATTETVINNTIIKISSTCDKIEQSGLYPGSRCYLFHLAIIPKETNIPKDYLIINENYNDHYAIEPSEFQVAKRNNSYFIILISRSKKLNYDLIRKDYFNSKGEYLGSNNPEFNARYFRNFQNSFLDNHLELPLEFKTKLIVNKRINKYPDIFYYRDFINKIKDKKTYLHFNGYVVYPYEPENKEDESLDDAQFMQSEYERGYTSPYIAVSKIEKDNLKITAIRSCAGLPQGMHWPDSLCYGLKLKVENNHNKFNYFIIDHNFRVNLEQPNPYLSTEYKVCLYKSDNKQHPFIINNRTKCIPCGSDSYFFEDGVYMGSSENSHAAYSFIGYKPYAHEFDYSDSVFNDISFCQDIFNIPIRKE